jgi:hypothetical protein
VLWGVLLVEPPHPSKTPVITSSTQIKANGFWAVLALIAASYHGIHTTIITANLHVFNGVASSHFGVLVKVIVSCCKLAKV